MPFDAEKFCTDYSIPYWTEGKNISEGWIAIQCPFCHDHSNHGGFNQDEEKYSCWICGPHSMEDVLIELLEISFYEAHKIIQEYLTDTRKRIIEKIQKKKNTILTLPAECGPLQKRHILYLEKRNFDPAKIHLLYNLYGTNHLGPYKFRIIAPIFVDTKMVSYQGRDITGKQELRYKACKIQDEIIHHKHIVYNIDATEWDRIYTEIVVVEGITDVWRLGPGSVATFGTGWTSEQVLFLAKRKFKRIFILYDPEPIAQERANKLAWTLSSIGTKTKVVTLNEGDPDSMKQDDADHLMKELLR